MGTGYGELGVPCMILGGDRELESWNEGRDGLDRPPADHLCLCPESRLGHCHYHLDHCRHLGHSSTVFPLKSTLKSRVVFQSRYVSR